MVNEKLHLSILRMVGMYRVATRATITSLLPANTEADKHLSKLIKEGFLRAHTGLPGNRSVYQLTKKGAAEVDVSPARGRIAGAQSLLKNLGVLFFCHVPDTTRHRVEASALSTALGTELEDGAYCLCRFKEETIIFEMYVPGTQTPIDTVVRHIKKQLKSACKKPEIAQAIKDLRYGFAVIVPNPQRRKAIMDAVRTKAEGDMVPLIKRVRIWVEASAEFGAIVGVASKVIQPPMSSAAQSLLWESGS
jgi:hypothetical protein